VKKVGIVFAHSVFVIASYTSPLWLEWKLVVAGVLAYWLQLVIFKHCVLSTAQFGDKETTFHEWYLAKIGISFNRRTMRRVLNIWIPILLICIAYILQDRFQLQPLVAI
jgi:hypothetical protein